MELIFFFDIFVHGKRLALNGAVEFALNFSLLHALVIRYLLNC